MENNDEANIENSTRYRKFGLPNWMVNNIERLNFVTDFEQYACSPPETEGFLSEHIDNSDFPDASEPYCPIVIPNELADDDKPKSVESKVDTEVKLSPTNLLANATEKLASPAKIFSNLAHEEFYYSSPDSTPCPTPEPSPAPRRRMSGQQDTVQTNPGRWFYMGNIKKGDPIVKGQCLNINSNKENHIKHVDKSSEVSHKLRDSPIETKKAGFKLVISNFDINAVSPSSW